jgi:hypothetical protein
MISVAMIKVNSSTNTVMRTKEPGTEIIGKSEFLVASIARDLQVGKELVPLPAGVY